MTTPYPLHGLVAATHTPFRPDGSAQPRHRRKAKVLHLVAGGVGFVFIGGSTGESASLTLQERLDLAARWFATWGGGSCRRDNCLLTDSRTLAARAEELGAVAIAGAGAFVFQTAFAGGADRVLRGSGFGRSADAVLLLRHSGPHRRWVFDAGVSQAGAGKGANPCMKFTNPDLMAYQFCLRAGEGKWDVRSGG